MSSALGTRAACWVCHKRGPRTRSGGTCSCAHMLVAAHPCGRTGGGGSLLVCTRGHGGGSPSRPRGRPRWRRCLLARPRDRTSDGLLEHPRGHDDASSARPRGWPRRWRCLLACPCGRRGPARVPAMAAAGTCWRTHNVFDKMKVNNCLRRISLPSHLLMTRSCDPSLHGQVHRLTSHV